MEESRHNESYKSIRKPKINQSHQESEGQEKVVLPFRIYLESFRETQTQIFAYEDRSRWFEFILKRLRESTLLDKDLIEKYLRHQYRLMCKARTVETAYTNQNSLFSLKKLMGLFVQNLTCGGMS